MKKITLLFLALLCTISTLELSAQRHKKFSPIKGHRLIFDINHCQDTVVYLAIHYREKLMLKDTAYNINNQGIFIFEGVNKYDDGLYTLVSQAKKPYVNFIIDGEQNFQFNIDTIGDVRNFQVVNSPQNSEMLRFQRQSVKAQRQVNQYQERYKENQAINNQDSMDYYAQKLKEVNEEMQAFIKDLIEQNPNYLFSKMQKSYLQIELPDPPKNLDGTEDSTYLPYYYREHFWDNFDLTDRRFIFIPSFEPKLKEYFNQVLAYQETDTINKYVDKMLAQAYTDSLMYRFLIEWTSGHFETSKILGHDAVFVHIAKENQLKGKCKWIDEDLMGRYRNRVNGLEPLLIGKRATELIIPDTNLSDKAEHWHSLYRFSQKPYIVLWFYDPHCPTCKKESEKLRTVYDSLETIGKRNFDVYAVGSDSDIERWKKYVREKNYPWLNVGGNRANVDYLEAYNIYETGNPAMFIIDNRTKNIILNRRIEMSSIPNFLEQYEKIEKKKAEDALKLQK